MGAATMFFAIASLGLPGLGNFVAEFLVLLGVFAINPWLCAVTALGLITAAVYALVLVQRSFHGSEREERALRDFGWRDMSAMAAMMVGLLWLGLFPQTLLDFAAPVLHSLAAVVDPAWAPPGQPR